MNSTRRILFPLIIFCALLALSTTSTAQEPYPIGKIAILVDKRIAQEITPSLTNYINALESVEHMNRSNVFVDSQFDMGTPPSTIRSQLKNYYTQQGIEGAILIGDLQRVYFEETGVVIENSVSKPYSYPRSMDYYYMDLIYPTEPWKDSLTTDPPYYPGMLDVYAGDYHAEIWVSRILSRNLTQFRDLQGNLFHPRTTKAHEVMVINDYLQRVVSRMTSASSVPQHGFLMGDDVDIATTRQFEIPVGDYLKLPYYLKIGRPDDTPENWMDHLRRTGDAGFAWAFVAEHSDPWHNSFQLNAKPRPCDAFYSTSLGDPDNYSGGPDNYVDMTKDGGAPSQCLFYTTSGCSNVDITKLNCLGQLYAMGHNGLISRGNSFAARIYQEDRYYKPLGLGATFGQAFLQWMNSRCSNAEDIAQHLIGAGTLRSREYVSYSNRQIVITGTTAGNLSCVPPWIIGDATSIFAHIECSDVNFRPENATYTWTLDGQTYSGVGLNPCAISFQENTNGTLEVSANGYVSARREIQLYPDVIAPFIGDGASVGLSSDANPPTATGSLVLKGLPGGNGKLCADNSPNDMADNFIYAPLKENGDNVLSFSSKVNLNPTDPDVWESTAPGVAGIMVRETDANGITTPGSPYICLYFTCAPMGVDIYFQYRTVANGHAHRQFVTNSNGNGSLYLDRSGMQIIASIDDVYKPKTAVGAPITFLPANYRYMFVLAGKANDPDVQRAGFRGFFQQKKGIGLQVFNANSEKMRISSGDMGSMFALGTEQTGAKTGLIFSNVASFTTSGDIMRTGSLFNRKWWFEDESRLRGGLIFRDPLGIPIIHMSTGGTITARNGILPLSQF